MSFNFQDLANPLVIRFNKGIETFIEIIQTKLKDSSIRIAIFEYCSNGFIRKAVLYKEINCKRTLRFEIYPRINGTFEYVLVDTVSTKKIKGQCSEVDFWGGSVEHGMSYIKAFFKKELVYQRRPIIQRRPTPGIPSGNPSAYSLTRYKV